MEERLNLKESKASRRLVVMETNSLRDDDTNRRFR